MNTFTKNNFEIIKIADKKSTKKEITGLFISPKETVVTDSFSLIRVSSKKVEYKRDLNGDTGMTNFKPTILPYDDAKEIGKMLPRKTSKTDYTSNLAVVLDSNPNQITIGNKELNKIRKLSCKPIEGRYPEYQQMLEKPENSQEISVDVDKLYKLLRYIRKFMKGTNLNNIKINVPEKDGKPLYISGENQKKGQDIKALLMPINEE